MLGEVDGMADGILYRVNRKRSALVLLASLLLTAGAAWMAPEYPLLVVIAAFFGLCSVILLLQSLPSAASLRLDPEGFEVRSLGRVRRTRWQDVSAFRIASIQGTKMIGIEYAPDYEGQKSERNFASMISGGTEGAIADQYDAPAEEIAKTLNEWQERYS